MSDSEKLLTKLPPELKAKMLPDCKSVFKWNQLSSDAESKDTYAYLLKDHFDIDMKDTSDHQKIYKMFCLHKNLKIKHKKLKKVSGSLIDALLETVSREISFSDAFGAFLTDLRKGDTIFRDLGESHEWDRFIQQFMDENPIDDDEQHDRQSYWSTSDKIRDDVMQDAKKFLIALRK